MKKKNTVQMMDFVRRIHFVGIGGVGMSGIAQVLLNLGYKVSGSDLKLTEVTRRLAAAGAKISKGHKAGHIRKAEVVVTSTAVSMANPEVRAARAKGIPVIPRVEMLAELARLKKTVTVSGTHGKTTTTAMTAMALRGAGADPTMIVGGQITNLGTNARLGMGDILVAEADESDGSFLKLKPLVAIVTNIDSDHLDYYGSYANLQAAFLTHIQSLPFYGAAVLCADDPGVAEILPLIERETVITYGLRSGLWRGKILSSGARRAGAWRTRVEVRRGRNKIGVLDLKVAGRHNALNALAAIAAADFLGMDMKKAFRGLSEFEGVGRRMESLGFANGVTFIDDYGHHPTEIEAVLETVKGMFPGRRIVPVFQPHRYSRTKALYKEFGGAFKRAGRVYVMDIYPAGEKPIRGVRASLIVDAARRAGVRAEAFTRSVDLMLELKRGDVVVTLGAGDVWKTGLDLLRRLKRRTLAAL